MRIQVQPLPVPVHRDLQPFPDTLYVRHLLLTAIASLSGFMYGYNFGVTINGESELAETFSLSPSATDAIFVLFAFGAMLSSIIAAPVTDWLGRRSVILFACLIFIMGDLITTAATTSKTLLIGRFLTGVSTGFASTAVPMYICECAPFANRGLLGVSYQFAIMLGVMVSSLGHTLRRWHEIGWRIQFGVVLVPAFGQLVGLALMPESPRWLMARGKKEEAEKVMVWTGRHRSSMLKMLSAEDQNNGAGEEIKEKDETKEKQKSSSSGHSFSCSDALGSVLVLRTLFVACLLQVARQLSGLNTLLYHMVSVITIPGFEPRAASALNLNITMAIINIATIFVFLRVDIVGRRTLFLFSLFGVSCSLLFLAVILQVTGLQPPLVPERLGPPLEAPCYSNFSCHLCARLWNCGFCSLAENATSADEGFCLPVANETTARSLYGACDDGGGALFQWNYRSCPAPTTYTAIVVFLIYILSLAVGVAPLPWVINAELFSDAARSTGVGIANFASYSVQLILTGVFIVTSDSVPRYVFFYILSLLSLLLFAFLWVALPESKRRQLDRGEQMILEKWDFRLFKI